jgi:hypothetical protein
MILVLMVAIPGWLFGGPFAALWVRRRTGRTWVGLAVLVLWYVLPNLDGLVARPLMEAWREELPNIRPERIAVAGFLDREAGECPNGNRLVPQRQDGRVYRYVEVEIRCGLRVQRPSGALTLPPGYFQFYRAPWSRCQPEQLALEHRPDFMPVNAGGETICLQVERTDRPISTYENVGWIDLDPGPWRRRFGISAGCQVVREIATGRDVARSCTFNTRTFLMILNRQFFSDRIPRRDIFVPEEEEEPSTGVPP